VAELEPIPFARLARRAFHELARRQAIFDLPAKQFYRGPVDLDLAVPFGGSRAGSPIGPAAGPHTQLAQNIVLCWLAGARIIELKTVQANDRVTLLRPCIDMATVGYNTEWSQELRLEESAREYVKASMLIELLGASGLAGIPADGVVFDISVGYDLAGIRSSRVVNWLETMRNADVVVEELRRGIPDEFARWRGLDFRTEISRSITLSTFHGAPAGEIERICEFLIGELGFHAIVKLNPPMLGRDRLESLLHDTLGYSEIEVSPGCYERNLAFDDAVGMIRRLQPLAAARGVSVGVKCGNTLEVINKGSFLKEPVQYLSGQPLHLLHLALVARWREQFGGGLPISFSAGVDALNVADCVATGLAAVTTCTDLLRTGGYGRLPRYLTNIESRMRTLGALTIPEFIIKTDEAAEPPAAPRETVGAGDTADAGDTRGAGDTGGAGAAERLSRAMVRNTDRLVARALEDERYRAPRNRKPPRKVGSHLVFWDCLNCDKCIPVCPNDANFQIEIEPLSREAPVIEVDRTGWRQVAIRRYAVKKRFQIATFADACNLCGNCDVFCPEDGGPYLEKPRFFGSLDAWQRAGDISGFVLTLEPVGVLLRGRFCADSCSLAMSPGNPIASFRQGPAVVKIDWETHAPVSSAIDDGATLARVDLSYYLSMRLLLGALLRPERINFVNALLFE
jgi:putative selenate reductase